MKTSTKRKAISKKDVNEKRIALDKAIFEAHFNDNYEVPTVEQVKDWGRYNHDWQEGDADMLVWELEAILNEKNDTKSTK